MPFRSVFPAIGIAALIALAPDSVTAATAEFSLESPQKGSTLEPGAVVEWSILFILRDECEGLALAVVDLEQDPRNPALIDIPPAEGVPTGMEAFSPPLGFSNPGAGGADSGYLGTPVGPAGARNLAQIGGAQNTFGVAGEGMGQSTTVVAGVGLDGPLVLARGSFTAPQTPGEYRFVLSGHRVNVITHVQEPPLIEPARIDREEERALTFAVGAACGPACFVRGNCNGTGEIDISDAIFLLRSNFVANSEQPPCLAACDADGDGHVTGTVTDSIYLLQFVFLGGMPPPSPFPACGAGTDSDAELGCAVAPPACR